MRYRKRTVDRVVEDAYWEGFFACLYGREKEEPLLGYGSTSGLYRYKEIRRIAYRHGVRGCLGVLRKRGEGRFIPLLTHRPRIPPEVYAEAYAEARIARPASRRRLRVGWGDA